MNPGSFTAASSGYQPLFGFPRSLRIIVADDEADTVRTLEAILKDEGHEVIGLQRGADVLGQIASFVPEVLIVDISMPEMNGYDLAKEVRRRLGRVPLLIAISGVYRKETDKLLSHACGFDHHLLKPCDPAEVVALLAPLAE